MELTPEQREFVRRTAFDLPKNQNEWHRERKSEHIVARLDEVLQKYTERALELDESEDILINKHFPAEMVKFLTEHSLVGFFLFKYITGNPQPVNESSPFYKKYGHLIVEMRKELEIVYEYLQQNPEDYIVWLHDIKGPENLYGLPHAGAATVLSEIWWSLDPSMHEPLIKAVAEIVAEIRTKLENAKTV